MTNRTTWLFDFGESDEAEQMIDNVKQWAQVHGVTQKRLLLLGIAQYMENNGSGGEIIKEIADYIAMPRKNASRRSR